MQVTLRKIGNSRGVIIPSAVIEQLNIESEMEMTLQDDGLFLKPIKSLRQGWFENYDVQKDVQPLSGLKEKNSEQEEWEW